MSGPRATGVIGRLPRETPDGYRDEGTLCSCTRTAFGYWGARRARGTPDQVLTRMLADVWQSADGKTWRQVTNQAPWSGSYNAVVFRDRMWVIGRGGVALERRAAPDAGCPGGAVA